MNARTQPLRLIIDAPASGSWNMSVDQALLESVEDSKSSVLRIYRWAPATLSLGYFQSYDERLQHAESLLCDVVRRASGGGAILHEHEITYSLCIPRGNRWSSKNNEIYDRVHSCIIDVLKRWSVDALPYIELDCKPTTRPNRFLCFQRRYAGDLILDNHKIVGSAQRRSKTALLQHGSILLRSSKFAPQVPGITDIASCEIDESELISLFADSICSQFRFEVREEKLTDQEYKLAEWTSSSRFGNETWTRTRKWKR